MREILSRGMKRDKGPTGPAAAGGRPARASASMTSFWLRRKKPAEVTIRRPLDQMAPRSIGRLKRASWIEKGKTTSTFSGGGLSNRAAEAVPMTWRFSRVMWQIGQEASARG